jgi:urate oxidase
MSSILTHNNYGKSRVRLLKVARHGERHDLQEITVNIMFEGDFATAHTAGDNSKILPTDTMKNTVYALAKQTQGIEEIESFAQRLTDHFLDNNPQTSRVMIEIAEDHWERIQVGEKPHHHSFLHGSNEKHTARVTATREAVTVESGIEDLLVLKTTMSGFFGYLKDRYTTLKETADRVLATAIKANWRYSRPGAATSTLWHGVRQTVLETFAQHDSMSVQHTLYAIGDTVLESFEDIVEISLSLPNKHCLLFNLEQFGMENNNEIFVPTDEPHGLIEARVIKNGWIEG